LRLIENLPPNTRAELLQPTSSSRAVTRVPTAAAAAITVPYAVVPRQSTGTGPFLAQFLAQDTEDQLAGEQPGGEQLNPALWRQRDAAYRLAATPAPTSEINIEI
jgi:hypothetical protein